MDIELLKNMMVIFGLSVAVLYVFHQMRAPTIVGFLITGVLAGPAGLGIIRAPEQVEVLAEIGLVLLLFTVGLEVSLADILRLKRYVLVGGGLQVMLTIAAFFLILTELGRPLGEALILGFLLSLSSTAIVLRILQRKGQFDSIYGRTTLGILIFQDMIVVPMMLVIPLLPGSLQTVAVSPMTILLRGGLMVALVIIGARWAVPRALYQVAKTKDRELFLLSIVAICFAVTYLSYLSGLSLGLGAFLAGLIISESPYSHQAFGNVLPLRDAFSSFFFISIGMLLNLEFVGRNLPEVLALTLGAMILKALIAGLAVLAMGLAFRVSVQVGLALSQIGEFSFILSKAGFESGIISPDVYQLFLDIAVLTMAATSFLMAASPRIADGLLRLPLPEKMRNGHLIHPSDSRLEERDHLIIVGFGVNGRNVAMSARAQGIPYLIVEMDPQIVREESARGEPIIFGDAATESVLLHVGARSARVMVIAISDAASTRRIVELARRISPGLFIIARTRYLQEMGPLQEIGADVVIPEEYETSVEIFARVLEHYGIPRGEIESFVEKVRSDGYEMFRSLYQEPVCSASITPLSEEIAALQVPASAEGKTVGEIGERGVVTLAVHRDLQTIPNPGRDLRLRAGDVAVLMGPPERIRSLSGLFGKPGP